MLNFPLVCLLTFVWCLRVWKALLAVRCFYLCRREKLVSEFSAQFITISVFEVLFLSFRPVLNCESDEVYRQGYLTDPPLQLTISNSHQIALSRHKYQYSGKHAGPFNPDMTWHSACQPAMWLGFSSHLLSSPLMPFCFDRKAIKTNTKQLSHWSEANLTKRMEIIMNGQKQRV